VETVQTRELASVARDLEQEMFAVPRGKMESDPFRFLSVGDAEILPEQVRVDKVTVHKRSERALDQQRMEMHAERLMSEADGGGAKPFRITVGLEEAHIHHPRVKELVTRPLDWEFVRLSCNHFFRNRMEEEEHSFDTLYAGLKWREWLNLPEGCWLLRVGRYSHFESLSVDTLRRGENRFTHAPIRGMGGSRSSSETATGRPAPFGWLMLRPAD
jgi:CRISPR-associated protein Csm5